LVLPSFPLQRYKSVDETHLTIMQNPISSLYLSWERLSRPPIRF